MSDPNEGSGPDKPKIIIDEDWKSQVQAEKEAAARKQQAAQSEESAEPSGAAAESAETVAADAAAASSGGEPDQSAVSEESGGEKSGDAGVPSDFEMPPASFSTLVTMLAAQAMVALGQVPDPVAGDRKPEPKIARHYIDTLGVLEEKTKGNLTADEQAMLTSMLHQLRMAFVNQGQ